MITEREAKTYVIECDHDGYVYQCYCMKATQILKHGNPISTINKREPLSLDSVKVILRSLEDSPKFVDAVTPAFYEV